MTESTAQPVKGHKQEKVGVVVSAKMAKTIVVEVTRRIPHPLYKKVITKRKKFYAHDEENIARPGDVVRIVESRPLSRLKRWRLVEIIRRAPEYVTTAPVEEVIEEPGAGTAPAERRTP